MKTLISAVLAATVALGAVAVTATEASAQPYGYHHRYYGHGYRYYPRHYGYYGHRRYGYRHRY